MPFDPAETNQEHPPGSVSIRQAAAVLFGGVLASMVAAALIGERSRGALGWSVLASIPMWLVWGFGSWRLRRETGQTTPVKVYWYDPLAGLSGALVQLVVGLAYRPWVSQSDVEAPARELAQRAASSPGGVWLLVMMAAICAPIAEEFVYRGLVLPALRRSDGLTLRQSSWRTGGAVLVTGLLFAALHLQLLQLPGLWCFGIAAGAWAVCSGRLAPAMWCHIGFNVVALWQLRGWL